MRRTIHKSWQVLFWRGALAVAFGIVAFGWPLMTFGALVVLFGGFAIFDGALTFLLAARSVRATSWTSTLLAEGIAGIGAGSLAMFAPWIGTETMLFVLALWAVATGVLQIAAGLTLRRALADEWALVIGGVASMSAGIVLFFRPDGGAVFVAAMLGAYALVFGVSLVALSLRLRRDGTRHAPTSRGGVS